MTTEGDAGSSRLVLTVIVALAVVTAAVTIISIFVPQDQQGAALGVIEKLAIPVITGLMAIIYMKLTKVEHTVNSKSDKQDAKIAELEEKVKTGRQDPRDEQQALREVQLQRRAESLDAVAATKEASVAKVAGDAAVAGAAAAVAAHESAKVEVAHASAPAMLPLPGRPIGEEHPYDPMKPKPQP